TVHGNDACRHARHHRIVGNVPADQRVRADGDIVAHANPADHLRARTDVDVVADDGRALALAAAGHADGDILRDVDVAADHRLVADPDAAEVTDVEAGPDPRHARDHDPVLEAELQHHELHDGQEQDAQQRTRGDELPHPQ